MGSIRSNAILRQMPQYKAIQNNMIALREQYEAEAKKSEKDFQRKFEEFMQGQKDFPKTILEKRQNELESMLETNAAFRIKVQALLAEAEKSMIADVKAELADAIEIAAQERGVSIVFDLDNGSVPYVVGGLTIDLTPHVLKVLGIDPSNN
jgi:outer membrane protein